VVGLGLRAAEVLTAAPFRCPAVNLDLAAADGAEGFGFAAAGSDVEATFAALAAKSWGLDETADARRALDRAMLGRPFGPAHVYGALDGTWRDVRLVIDTGYFCTIAEHAWRSPDAGRCLSSGSGRYMGIGLPQALAAADLDRRIPTVLAVGDGGIGPFLAEARLAVEHRLPLVVLHLSDGGYGSVRTRAIRDGLTQAPLLQGRRWLDVFDAFGWDTAAAASEDGVCRALEGGNLHRTPLFVEVRFDPDHYQAMVEGIR
jgi:acetolactate synthase-1/2/3 large subunit